MKKKIIVGGAVGVVLLFAMCGKSEKQKQEEQAQRDAQMLNGMFQTLSNVRNTEAQIQQQQQAERAQRTKLREDIRAGMPTPRVGSTEWIRQNDDGVR